MLLCYNHFQQPNTAKTVNGKSTHDRLVAESRGRWEPGTGVMPKFSRESHAEARWVVGNAGVLRRYPKGGIGFGPYSAEVARGARVTKVVPRVKPPSFSDGGFLHFAQTKEE